MYTSYFGNLKKLPTGLKPVAICQGVPQWFAGPVEQRLAPSWKMLRMSRDDYDLEFRKILSRLDPREIYESLGEDAVLLCYEKPNEWCRRRLVAEWLEDALGIEVPEFGLSREKTLPYELCGRAPQPEPECKPEPGEPKLKYRQMELFGYCRG